MWYLLLSSAWGTPCYVPWGFQNQHEPFPLWAALYPLCVPSHLLILQQFLLSTDKHSKAICVKPFHIPCIKSTPRKGFSGFKTDLSLHCLSRHTISWLSPSVFCFPYFWFSLYLIPVTCKSKPSVYQKTWISFPGWDSVCSASAPW